MVGSVGVELWRKALGSAARAGKPKCSKRDSMGLRRRGLDWKKGTGKGSVGWRFDSACRAQRNKAQRGIVEIGLEKILGCRACGCCETPGKGSDGAAACLPGMFCTRLGRKGRHWLDCLSAKVVFGMRQMSDAKTGPIGWVSVLTRQAASARCAGLGGGTLRCHWRSAGAGSFPRCCRRLLRLQSWAGWACAAGRAGAAAAAVGAVLKIVVNGGCSAAAAALQPCIPHAQLGQPQRPQRGQREDHQDEPQQHEVHGVHPA